MFKTNSVLMDLVGTDLLAEEQDMLAHPLIGGLILFSRNFEDSTQLKELIYRVRQAAQKPILITVDHEGGRVQRFKTDGFTHLPAMGKIYDFHQRSGQSDNLDDNCQQLAWLMASECLAHDIDLSFAPVLDLDSGSDVIGDRAFHCDVNRVTAMAKYWCKGVMSAGMASVGKHFPGHGSVKEDSHIASPVDTRSYEQIAKRDMAVFKTMIEQGLVQAIMPAHVRFSAIDNKPVGYSEIWLKQILKKQLGFNGLIFSDDLSMVAAGEHLAYHQRAELALSAGCDIVLVCNNIKAAQQVLDNLHFAQHQTTAIGSLQPKQQVSLGQLQKLTKWQQASELSHKIASY